MGKIGKFLANQKLAAGKLNRKFQKIAKTGRKGTFNSRNKKKGRQY